MSNAQQRQPYISVLIITYNYEKELQRALDAICAQTFRDFEVIVVDDCSKDNTVSMMDGYIKAHPETDIRLVCHSENRGIIAARNTALSYANGVYCYMHDADDWMDKDCLEILACEAKQNQADRIIAEFRDVDTTGKVQQIRNLPKHPSHWLYPMHDGCLYKRSVITENDIKYEDRSWDDLTFNFLFSCKLKKASFVHRPVHNYYVNPDSESGSNTTRNNTNIRKFSQLTQLYKEKEPELSEQDRIMAQYCVIKYYYSAILQEGRYMDYSALMEKYNKLHHEMKNSLPKYRVNKNIRLFRPNGERTYGRVITWGLITLEKLRLFKMALWLYLKLSKFIYFPV